MGLRASGSQKPLCGLSRVGAGGSATSWSQEGLARSSGQSPVHLRQRTWLPFASCYLHRHHFQASACSARPLRTVPSAGSRTRHSFLGTFRLGHWLIRVRKSGPIDRLWAGGGWGHAPVEGSIYAQWPLLSSGPWTPARGAGVPCRPIWSAEPLCLLWAVDRLLSGHTGLRVDRGVGAPETAGKCSASSGDRRGPALQRQVSGASGDSPLRASGSHAQDAATVA